MFCNFWIISAVWFFFGLRSERRIGIKALTLLFDGLSPSTNESLKSKEKQIDAEAYIIASAAVVNDKAYIGHYENEFLCININKGKIEWKYKDRAFAYASSPAVY